MSEKTYLAAIRETYHEAMAADPDTLVLGEDVRIGMLGTTEGLVEEFGEDRVLDTPISEQAFHGVAVGAAATGKRPIVEHQINTLAYVSMDQLVNNAAKLHYMTDGELTIPMTVLVPSAGAPGGNAAQHSDSPYPALLNYGMKSVVPATPYDLKGLFHAAIREDDPTFVFCPAKRLGERGEVPDEPYTVPLGEAEVKRAGEDVTVVAIGEGVHRALSVAEDLAPEIDVEVVDPRSLIPLDEETIFESVRKTSRVVLVEDANRYCGATAELAARIANHCVWSLDGPVKRVTRADAPISYSPPQEAAVLVQEETIEQAVRDVMW